MSWIDDLFEAPGRALCSFTGGHDFRVKAGMLVCSFCGKVVRR